MHDSCTTSISSRVLDYIRADPGFLAVSPQATLVMNPVVGCCYFLTGPQLLSHPKEITLLGRYHTILLGDRGVSSLPKITSMQLEYRKTLTLM